MEKQPIVLLPDSGLPIEKEVDRTFEACVDIDEMMNNFRERMASKWDKRGENVQFRDAFCQSTQRVLIEAVRHHLVERIVKRRGKDGREQRK